MNFLNRAILPNTKTYVRHLQNVSEKDTQKIKDESGIPLTEKDRVSYNRQNVQTKIHMLLKNLLNEKLDNLPKVSVTSEYDKNMDLDYIFNYTVSVDGNYEDKLMEVKYNSEVNKFLLSSEKLPKEDLKLIEQKLSNAMVNIDTLVNAATDFKDIEVMVEKNKNKLLVIKTVGTQIEYNEEVYDVNDYYGEIYAEDIYKPNEELSITALVEFYNEDVENQTKYAVTFTNQKIEHVRLNKIQDLASFVKVNTLINLFENVKNGHFNKTIAQSKNEEEFRQRSEKNVEELLVFAKTMNEYVSKEDLEIYANTKIDFMPNHGFQNMVSKYRESKNNNPQEPSI